MILNTGIGYFYLLLLIFVMKDNFRLCDGKRTAINLERPKIIYYNTSYFKNVFLSSKKYNRTNQLHFFTLRTEIVRPIDNTFTMSLYLYQLLSNMYKRSFVELHIRVCDLFLTDKIIGKMATEAYYRNPVSQRPMKVLACPLQPGYYTFNDAKLSLIDIPEFFPFPEGRLFINLTHETLLIGTGHLDFIIKTIN